MRKCQTYTKFKENLLYEINKVKNQYSDYVFLCIGTSKITGDAFGPFVGEFLTNIIPNEEYIHVIGNIKNNVSYLNAENSIKQIYEQFENPCIIAIDSALSNTKNIGEIFVRNTPVKLGKCIGKKKYEIGNISITGVVGPNVDLPFYNFLILSRTSPKFVINLAKNVAKGIYEVNSHI